MDTSTSRPQLPSLHYVDLKSEESQKSRTMGTSQEQHPAASATTSPTYPYPGAPSAFGAARSNAPPAYAWPNSQSSNQTPPESRRASEEASVSKSAVRQSLPSLSEIIGGDSSSFGKLPPPPSTLLPGTSSLAGAHDLAPRSPPSQRSYPVAGNAPYSSYPPPRPEPLSRPAYPSAEHGKPAFPPSEESGIVARPPPPYSVRERSPPREHVAHPAAPMGPPNVPYSYAGYPSRQEPPPQHNPGPIYQPSTVFGAPPVAPTPWKSEPSAYDHQPRPDAYKETIKRHLDSQNIEFALGEIAHSSGILSDFARRYGDQLYASQRAGLSLSKLPSLVEVDDMATKSKVQLDQLMIIREFITQQAAYEHQAADQLQNRNSAAEKHAAIGDHSSQDGDDKLGSFSADSKKPRRGRAAPPGRCHSCNRAETPEWRRGPDGARTLCNACGLHYAKLTRKNNGANNKGSAMTGSGLRNSDPMQQ